MENLNTFGQRLKHARKLKSMSQDQLAKTVGVTQGLIGQIERDEIEGSKHTPKIADVLGVGLLWLTDGIGDMLSATSTPAPHYRVEVAPDDDPSLRIPYLDVRGSCGGGAENGYNDLISKGYLIKEKGWFDRLQTSNKHLVAIYCDGDSMFPFLSDGDMAIVDMSKTKPINGKVFAVDTPAGTRIKRLKQSVFGTWTLESDNQDKRTFPDESIPPEMWDQIVIRGQVVYRQGFA